MQVGALISDNTGNASSKLDAAFDRQLRAFGAEGQRRIEATRIAIVGLGGTGSVTAQALAHLGARDFILIDRDVIEETNLNRTVGTTVDDIGRAKVEIARRLIESIRPNAKVQAITGDVVDSACARMLLEVDFIFSCTDSHASRHLINQVAYQYTIPAIDMGVAIHAPVGQPVTFAGHVKALAPGLACLWCLNSLDPNQVRRELMSPELRAADPYFNQGHGLVQPAVITLNSTVASLAGTMFLSMVTGLDAPARYLVYDGNRQRVAHVQVTALAECSFCGPDSTAGAGDRAPLPVRV
jgi:molybdopterin-synthase adenylyltransferase